MSRLPRVWSRVALETAKSKWKGQHKLRATIKSLDKEYTKFASKGSLSLLAKYLDDSLYDGLKILETPFFKSTLLDCIQSGLKLPKSKIGVYAADNEAYKTFQLLFDPIIDNLHGFSRHDVHPYRDYGRPEMIKDIDPHNHYILFTRIRVDRNLSGYPFTPRMTAAEYKELGESVQHVLMGLKGDMQGLYHDLYDLNDGKQLDLMEDHMFKGPNAFMETAHMCRYLPTGRAIFINRDKKFSVWVNFEDHLKIVSMQQGADMGQVYRRLIKAVEAIELKLPSYRDCRLGFLTACPSKLGTTMRVSVLIKLIKLPKEPKTFQKLLDEFELTVRGTYGEYTPVVKGVYDITNRRCLGVNEYEVMRAVYDGAREIMRAEQCIKVSVRR